MEQIKLLTTPRFSVPTVRLPRLCNFTSTINYVLMTSHQTPCLFLWWVIQAGPDGDHMDKLIICSQVGTSTWHARSTPVLKFITIIVYQRHKG